MRWRSRKRRRDASAPRLMARGGSEWGRKLSVLRPTFLAGHERQGLNRFRARLACSGDGFGGGRNGWGGTRARRDEEAA